MTGLGLRRSQGFALIVVLWFLVLIGAMVTYLLANGRSETAIARNIMASASAEALADAAVAQAVFSQEGVPEGNRWRLDGAPHTIPLPGGEATIRLYDETWKINPNRASETLLAALFEAASIERARARRLGAAVADWVDGESNPRPLGAEAEQYASAGRSYGPPNGPIESLDELQLVLGMTPDVVALVRPYLTLHTETGRPNAKNAPPLIQYALTFEASQTRRQAVAEEVKEQAEEDTTQTADQRAEAEEAAAAEAAAEAEPDDTLIIAALHITARSANGGTFVREAVVRLVAASPKGYVVLDWRRGALVE